MKHQKLSWLLRSVVAVLFFSFSFVTNTEAQTPKYNAVNGNCGGYYEYLPQGYNSNTWQSYPLIVAVHGIGELGNGTSDLPNLLNCWTSIPRLIANGGFPSSFNVGGQNFSFIVICPQFKSWPSGADVNAVVDYAVQNYRVDQSRIYVTGLSMGGGSVWDFAGNYPTKAAAVVPVCGAASSDPTRASAIANAKLAVWATHNQDDPTVSVSNTTGWVNLINQYGGNIISTIFPVSGHDAWTKTYDPNFTQNGVNIYQWMLQHQKGNSSTTPPPTTTTNQSPTANAGNSQTITLPQSSVTLSGSGTDPDGTINFYQWSQTSGPSQASFSSLYSANPVVSGLVQGSYVFTLKVTDNGGATATSSVTITVNAAATGSTTSNLTSTISGSTRIEAENYANMSGVVKEGTSDAGGGQDVGYIDYGDWMDYNVNVSSAGSYAMNLRVASPTGGQLQIKNSAGTVLATVSIPATGGWQSWQTVTTNISLSAGTQTIRVYSTSNGWNFNWLEIAGAGGTTTTTTPTSSTTSGSTRIEAENYANMSGVVKEGTSDAGGGQDVGYIDYGDWMDYNVNVSSAGSYAMNLRVASPTGGQLQIKNSAGTVLATVSIPATGGWQSWQTVTTNISLSAGTQTIRVYSTSNGWNFNWLEIAGAGGTTTTTTPTSSTTSGSTRIEAENYANMSGVVKEGTSDAGGGQDVGYIDYGDWMDYNVNVSSAGSYAMNLRVASPTGGQLQIRNSAGTVLATVSIPATGGWQSWQTVTTNISLSAGTQTIRVYSTSNGWNFNWLEIAGAGTISAASVSKAEVVSSTSSVTTAALSIYPNPIVNSFELQINNDLTGQVSVQVYDVSGTLQKQFSLAKPDAGTSQYYLSIGTLSSGTYIIKVTMNSWTQSKQIIKQ